MPHASKHKREQRTRSRSPDRIHSSHKRRRSPVHVKSLPFSARLLDKHDLAAYKSLFASYLDIQKQIDLNEISEIEVKGRWKSFTRKWNQGELAEGWYDPDQLKRAAQNKVSSMSYPLPSTNPTAKESIAVPQVDDEDGDYGPAPALASNMSSRAGPSIPTMDDLAVRRETEREDRESTAALAKASRRAEARLEKQRLEDLVPRAEAGTRERQLEKKRELAASNKVFAESKGGGAGGNEMVEVGEADLLGGGDDDSLEGIRRRKKEEERKLSERELKREEFARARREEMEQRKKDFTEKEEARTQRFIELAKQRFG